MDSRNGFQRKKRSNLKATLWNPERPISGLPSFDPELLSAIISTTSSNWLLKDYSIIPDDVWIKVQFIWWKIEENEHIWKNIYPSVPWKWFAMADVWYFHSSEDLSVTVLLCWIVCEYNINNRDECEYFIWPTSLIMFYLPQTAI